jgi:S-adenosylmethionine synthetase
VIFLSLRAGREAPFDPAALARRVIEEAGYAQEPALAAPTVILDLVRDGEAAFDTSARMTTSFGHACRHTPERLAYSIWSAHRLTRALDAARRDARIAWLGPDAQAQVAVEFRDRAPVAIRAVSLTATAPDLPEDAAVREAFMDQIVEPAFDGAAVRPDDRTRMVFAGISRKGGPSAHSGLTGRKLSDDTYGGFVRQSTSALSGKAPSRIDRIAAYAARQAARCVLEAGLAGECEVQLSYIAGEARPASIEVDSFNSGAVADETISARLREVFDFRAEAIAERMDLWNLPSAHHGRFYRCLGAYGQIGRDELLPPWEDTGLAARLA